MELWGKPRGVEISGEFNTDERRNWKIMPKGNREDSKTAWASNESFLTDNGTWKIGNSSVSPDKLDDNDYSAFEDNGSLNVILADVEEYAAGKYFVPVFGKRDTRSLDLTLRSSLTFTSKFSIQLYSQLFLARGR